MRFTRLEGSFAVCHLPARFDQKPIRRLVIGTFGQIGLGRGALEVAVPATARIRPRRLLRPGTTPLPLAP